VQMSQAATSTNVRRLSSGHAVALIVGAAAAAAAAYAVFGRRTVGEAQEAIETVIEGCDRALDRLEAQLREAGSALAS
jgi:hypothetical protein